MPVTRPAQHAVGTSLSRVRDESGLSILIVGSVEKPHFSWTFQKWLVMHVLCSHPRAYQHQNATWDQSFKAWWKARQSVSNHRYSIWQDHSCIMQHSAAITQYFTRIPMKGDKRFDCRIAVLQPFYSRAKNPLSLPLSLAFSFFLLWCCLVI